MAYPPHASQWVYLVQEFERDSHTEEAWFRTIGVYTSRDRAIAAAQGDLDSDAVWWVPTPWSENGGWSLYKVQPEGAGLSAVLYRQLEVWGLNKPPQEREDQKELWDSIRAESVRS
jgi:hypothetical protein